MKENRRITLTLVITVALVVLTAACQAGAAGPEIVIEEVWGRPSPKAAAAGAFYMVIKNTGNEPDRLIAADSTSCGVVELHESYDLGEGVMGMRPVEGGTIEIPARDQVALKMGGLHLMCIDKLDDFDDGAVLSLTLVFEESGEKAVEVEIRQPDT